MISLKEEATAVMEKAIADAMPGDAVRRAIRQIHLQSGKVILIAIGKAAWEMAHAADRMLGDRIDRGIVITKYGHLREAIGKMELFEAGHPLPDENSIAATEHVLGMIQGLKAEDNVLFLVSGGGSALFEKPLIPLGELQDLNRQFLASGASIEEINVLRKRLSGVKGGKFAGLCAPARVYTVILSDIIGDPPDLIASGPTAPDLSTASDARSILQKYHFTLTPESRALLETEAAAAPENNDFFVTGNVQQLCVSARDMLTGLGYETICLTSSLNCEAKEAGAFLSAIAREHQNTDHSLAFLAGGETVVRLTGNGLGGRNQEIALSAAKGLEGCLDTCVFSFGSDGTDGPTDAAGGYANEKTASLLRQKGILIDAVLQNNDAYHALESCGGLLRTGPTGTNVNDLSVLMIKRGNE